MSDLIDRAPGDDVIVPVRMRRSSFEKLCSTPDGRSVEVGGGMIGLVPDAPATLPLSPDAKVWTFVVWTGDPVWRGVPEQIPGNETSFGCLSLADDEDDLDLAAERADDWDGLPW